MLWMAIKGAMLIGVQIFAGMFGFLLCCAAVLLVLSMVASVIGLCIHAGSGDDQ